MEHFLVQQASLRTDVRVTRSSTLRPEVNPRCKLNDVLSYAALRL